MVSARARARLRIAWSRQRSAVCAGRVLVHCVKGVSRSASVVVAYLMKTQQWGFDQALEYVRARRPQVGAGQRGKRTNARSSATAAPGCAGEAERGV